MAAAKDTAVPLTENSPIFVQTETVSFPNIGFYTPSGEYERLSHSNGTLRLISFWATWCIPCIAELPQLQTLQNHYGKKLHIIMIGEDQKGFKTMQPFINKHGLQNLTYRWDKRSTEFRKLRMRGLPASFLIDEDGHWVATVQGKIDWLAKDIKHLLDTQIHKE